MKVYQIVSPDQDKPCYVLVWAFLDAGRFASAILKFVPSVKEFCLLLLVMGIA